MRKARTLFDQLCALDNSITKEALVCDVLEGLGLEFCPFKRAIEACNSPIVFDELYALLLREETQLKFDSLQLASAVPPTVHYGNVGRGGRGTSRHGGRNSCGRGNQGHGFENSTNSGRNLSIGSSNGLLCYNCNGHQLTTNLDNEFWYPLSSSR